MSRTLRVVWQRARHGELWAAWPCCGTCLNGSTPSVGRSGLVVRLRHAFHPTISPSCCLCPSHPLLSLVPSPLLALPLLSSFNSLWSQELGEELLALGVLPAGLDPSPGLSQPGNHPGLASPGL